LPQLVVLYASSCISYLTARDFQEYNDLMLPPREHATKVFVVVSYQLIKLVLDCPARRKLLNVM
jgi:hypothetical protein